MPTVWVSYHGSETLEDTYRRSDGDEYGYQLPVELIERVEAAAREHDAAVEAVRAYITDHRVPEVELDAFDGEDRP